MILDHVLLPIEIFLLLTSKFVKSFVNTMFTTGNHVRLDISIWKMGPKSGTLEEWMHRVLWYPGQKFWRREENQDPRHVCLTKTLFYAHHLVIHISSYMLITCCFSWHINSLKVWSNSNSLCCRTSYWHQLIICSVFSCSSFYPVPQKSFFSSQQHLTFGWHVACGYDVFEMLYMLGALSVPEGDL